MTLETGSLLRDRYRIEGMLGKGGMGAVYVAFDQTLQLRVAVKENLNTGPESERQFQREASLLASLRHPNLPRVTDHFLLEGRQYLVMDFIEGEDLHAHLRRGAPSVNEILQWADALCDALTYLHSRQPPIIHRDIKPANVKIQPDGTPVLVDFGLAKVFDQAQTTTGARGLTPGYSPPEQYGGARTDARTDQYALAATIYTLLTGGRPPTDSIERMLDKVELPPPSSINPAVPAHVDAAVMRGLSIEQAARYPDIHTFREALHGRLDAATIRVAAPTVLARPQARRVPWIPIAIGAVAILAILGVGGALLIGGFLLKPGGLPTATAPIALALPTNTERAIASPVPATPTLAPSDTPVPSPTPLPAYLPGGGGGIAFVSDREDGRTLQIWWMLPDGTGARQLTYGPGDKAQPRWSPDGQRLLFVASGGTDSYGNNLGLDVWSMNADGTGVANLTANVGDDTDPAWSPDGARIAFASTRSNDVRQVFVADIACTPAPGACSLGKPRNYSYSADFNAVEYSPVWSPDGARLAVVASINGAPGRIYFHPGILDSVAAPTPSAFDRSDTIIGADHLDWSSDGLFLVYTWKQPGSNEIYIVPADDAKRWQRLTTTAGNKEPAFSPDGQFIVFTSTRDQNPEIYLMPVGGGNQTNLTQSPSTRDMQPDWQPSGSG
jgi:serine/threonine protein kinase/Tol biopolymer transport system component